MFRPFVSIVVIIALSCIGFAQSTEKPAFELADVHIAAPSALSANNTTGAQSGCQGQPQQPEPGVIPYQQVSCHNLTSAQIAENLRQMAGPVWVRNTDTSAF